MSPFLKLNYDEYNKYISKVYFLELIERITDYAYKIGFLI